MIRGVPYDAEVEYLESTGTQYIDTGVLCDNRTIIECGFFWSDTGHNVCVFGAYDNSSGTANRFMVQIPMARGPNAYWGSALATTTASPALSTWHDCILGDKMFKVDGATIQTWGNENFQFSASMFIFARHVKNVADLSNTVDSFYYGRVSHVRITQNGVLVRDFIPVRFTNENGQPEGAMYDRVTRRLFRNQWTGAFLLGPDVATPVMVLHMFQKPPLTTLDYVQDGIVAHWDGIENAGRRVHSDSPSNWTSLVGNGETILLQDHFVYSFDSNSLVTTGVAGTNTQYLTVPVIADLLNTSEWTVEVMVQCMATYTALIASYPWGGGGNFAIQRGNNVAYLMATDITGNKLFAGTGDATTGYMASYTLRYKAGVLYLDWMVVGENDARHDTIEWTKPALKTTNYSIGQNNKYHFIRLYSRALTAEEIAHNYAVDKERFKLP